MIYNTPQNIEALETACDQYHDRKEVLSLITEMCAGGVELKNNVNQYLLIRDDEPELIRQKRSEKFIASNHLGSAIRLQRTKLSTGSLLVADLPGEASSWSSFMHNVDRRGEHLKDFLLDAIEQALKTQYAFCLIDKPNLQVPSKLNKAQLENFLQKNGFDKVPPHLLLLSPLEVINWSESDKGINWIKFKKILPITQPLGETLYDLAYVLVDDQHFTTFTFKNVKIANDTITQIWDESKQEYRSFDKEKDLATPNSIAHNRGTTPVVKLELPDSLYTASQAFLAQKVLFGLEANLLHTTTNSGFIQKYGKPFLISNGSSPAAPTPEYLKKALVEFQDKMGDESFLAAEKFEFAELKGDSIATQMEVIKSLEKYIYSTISLGIASADPQVLQQSGVSKQMDQYLSNTVLTNLGSILITFAQQVLQHVTRAFNIKDESLLNEIKVSGLDDFDLDSIQNKVEVIEALSRLPGAPVKVIPDALYEDAALDLASSMTRNSDDLLRNKVQQQMKALYPDRQEPTSNLET